MKELQLLKKLSNIFAERNNVAVPIGDDCAAIDFDEENYLLLASDQLISKIHFLDNTPVDKIATKLLKRNLSDIAAMGGEAKYALLNLAVGGYENEWIEQFLKAIEECAKEYGVCVCGGDLASLNSSFTGDNLVASLTIVGVVAKSRICLRSNARDGDLLCVTGLLGNSFESEKHLDFVPRLKEGVFLADGFTDCMIDISDGLLLDSLRIAESSNLNIEFFTDKIPYNDCTLQNALSDGEDYELLFTIDPQKLEQLTAKWSFSIPFTCIGRFVKKNDDKSIIFDVSDGTDLLKKYNSGYVHK